MIGAMERNEAIAEGFILGYVEGVILSLTEYLDIDRTEYLTEATSDIVRRILMREDAEDYIRLITGLTSKEIRRLAWS